MPTSRTQIFITAWYELNTKFGLLRSSERGSVYYWSDVLGKAYRWDATFEKVDGTFGMWTPHANLNKDEFDKLSLATKEHILVNTGKPGLVPSNSIDTFF